MHCHDSAPLPTLFTLFRGCILPVCVTDCYKEDFPCGVLISVNTHHNCNTSQIVRAWCMSTCRMSCLRPCTASPTSLAAGQSCRRTSRLCFSEPSFCCCNAIHAIRVLSCCLVLVAYMPAVVQAAWHASAPNWQHLGLHAFPDTCADCLGSQTCYLSLLMLNVISGHQLGHHACAQHQTAFAHGGIAASELGYEACGWSDCCILFPAGLGCLRMWM